MPSAVSGNPRLKSSASAALNAGWLTIICVGTGVWRTVLGGSGAGIPVRVQPFGDGPKRCPQNAQKTHAAGAMAVQVSPQVALRVALSWLERSRALLVTFGFRLNNARSTWVWEVLLEGLLGRQATGGAGKPPGKAGL